MREQKKTITAEYLERLNNSPFFVVVDYQGLKVAPMTELRKRLSETGANMHVVKNSIFRIAAKDAGLGDLNESLRGQMAVVVGQKDIAAAAKVLKSFAKEFERPQIKFGYLNNERLEAQQVESIADLPPMETLRAMFLGVLQAPATKLVRLLQTPAGQLARVLKAKTEQAEQG